jgi:acetyl esterase/lipase
MAGDSAGGGLALACLIASRRAGLRFRRGRILQFDGASTDAIDDPVVNGTGLRMMAGVYLDGADPRDPLASPLYARDDELASLPPLLVQVGTREALLDDSRRFVGRATAAGVRVTYIEHPDVVHMWMVMAPELPETRQAFAAAAQFLSSLD